MSHPCFFRSHHLISTSLPRFHGYLYRSPRSFSVYVAGSAWTGALGLGHDAMSHPDISEVSDEERENKFTELHYNPVQLHTPHSHELVVLSAAAGWGHSAYIVVDPLLTTRLLVCGRPYDFQSLLRLKRIPSFLRKPLIRASILLDDATSNFSEDGRQHDKTKKYAGLMPLLTEISLPFGDKPMNATETCNRGHVILAASAGTTAVIGESGQLYMFGVNQRGQCAVNQPQTNHIWEPTPVVVSKSENLYYEPKFVSVALGLQHGLAIDKKGALFSWGKGNRGQLGVSKVKSSAQQTAAKSVDHSIADSKNNWFSSLDLTTCEYAAVKVTEFHLTESASDKEIIIPASDTRVTKISAGFNHSAAITESNHAWVWGKNTKSVSSADTSMLSEVACDSHVPINIRGLPSNMAIIDIACGSHHTSILMEDGSVYAIGIATDTLKPLLDLAVQIIPPGLIEKPVHQFTSHFDRTSVVHGHGSVIEVHLWEDFRNGGVFEPAWVQAQDFGSQHIKMVHRGWLHTIVVTSN